MTNEFAQQLADEVKRGVGITNNIGLLREACEELLEARRRIAELEEREVVFANGWAREVREKEEQLAAERAAGEVLHACRPDGSPVTCAVCTDRIRFWADSIAAEHAHVVALRERVQALSGEPISQPYCDTLQTIRAAIAAFREYRLIAAPLLEDAAHSGPSTGNALDAINAQAAADKAFEALAARFEEGGA